MYSASSVLLRQRMLMTRAQLFAAPLACPAGRFDRGWGRFGLRHSVARATQARPPLYDVPGARPRPPPDPAARWQPLRVPAQDQANDHRCSAAAAAAKGCPVAWRTEAAAKRLQHRRRLQILDALLPRFRDTKPPCGRVMMPAHATIIVSVAIGHEDQEVLPQWSSGFAPPTRGPPKRQRLQIWSRETCRNDAPA